MLRAIFLGIGCLYTAAYEPVGLWPLTPVLLLPLLYVILLRTSRESSGLAFYFGLGWFLSGPYWIYLSVTGPGNAARWIGVIYPVGSA